MPEQHDSQSSIRSWLEEPEFVRAVILENVVGLPEASDLVRQWDAIRPDAMDPNLPRYRARDVLVLQYLNWSITKPWAWEGLRQLWAELRTRREPIPEGLLLWADRAIARSRFPRRRGRKEQWDRNTRIVGMIRVFRHVGFTQEEAIQRIAEALRCSAENVRSAVRRIRTARPFDKPKRPK